MRQKFKINYAKNSGSDEIMEQIKKTQNSKEKLNKIKKNQQKSKYNRDKSKYFDYYDDIKHASHKVIDW